MWLYLRLNTKTEDGEIPISPLLTGLQLHYANQCKGNAKDKCNNELVFRAIIYRVLNKESEYCGGKSLL